MIPEELENAIKASYGALFSDIYAGFRERRAVTLRANPLKSSAEEIAETLDCVGIAYERAAWYPDAFALSACSEDDVFSLPVCREGKLYLQNLSSMLPPLILAPQAGENILDMAAAPGGKTTELAALSEGKALITACERDAIRFERLKYNLALQGATRVNAMKKDALALDDFLKFDKILLDAPCTGTGTITAGSRVRFSSDYLKKCVSLQRKLILKALKLLKKGGILVYSTCSLLKEENEGAVETALQSGARLLPIVLPDEIPRLPSREGTVTVLPTARFEGFFLAKFTR